MLTLIFFPVLLASWPVFVAASKDTSTCHPRSKSIPQKQLNSAEFESSFWFNGAQTFLRAQLAQQHQLNRKTAKNIILFLGDGMSLPTVTATRIYMGGPAQFVSFEKFPYFGLSKTYSVDKQVPDSAATATAYLSGVKANLGTIGVSAAVPRYDCTRGQQKAYHTASIAKWAQDAGKWAGLVTTARVTHASPAGVYAHTSSREWEVDARIAEDACDPRQVVDIARQLVEWSVGRELRVILGGGRRSFLNKTVRDETGESGRRTDGRDLINDWLQDKLAQNQRAEYVWRKRDLLRTEPSQLDYLLGLFSSSHLPYHSDLKRKGLTKEIPTLSEMTEAAIRLLSRNRKGYFLFVEGAKIDMAHHENRARRSLEETEEFAKAVELAKNLTSEADTLIVVTADHAHTMTISGNPTRNTDILGLNTEKADDNLAYTILSYANGPGYYKTFSSKKGRRKLERKDFSDPKRRYMATVPLPSSTHAGDDVGVYASGPYAHVFSGNYEQTNIPMLMAKAASIGPFAATAS